VTDGAATATADRTTPGAWTPSAARVWAVTLGLVAAGLAALGVVLATGAPPAGVAAGLVAVAAVSLAAYRSGGRFEFDARGGRPYAPGDPPVLRRALLEACERAGREPPALVVAELDVPGMMVGYDDGRPVVAVDPLLPRVVGPEGLRALYAHELGHLRVDLHTDALREPVPRLLGFAAFWTVLLAGRGPTVASVGTAAFLALATVSDRRVAYVRYALGFGAEPLALVLARYANRLEEFRADAYAATLVPPASVTEALYRLAAVATGENDEDVAGPVPWTADRSLRFAAFATHPSVEARAAALGCVVPAWARPYRPHREA
jgi:Zn-dependent protease with chaperone function